MKCQSCSVEFPETDYPMYPNICLKCEPAERRKRQMGRLAINMKKNGQQLPFRPPADGPLVKCDDCKRSFGFTAMQSGVSVCIACNSTNVVTIREGKPSAVTLDALDPRFVGSR